MSMFDPSDEQIAEAALYHAAKTIREEAQARREGDAKIEWPSLGNPAFGCEPATPNDRRPYPETIRRGS